MTSPFRTRLSEAELERRADRRRMIDRARANADVELVDGREFTLLHLPDEYVHEEEFAPRPQIALRHRRVVSRA